MDAVEQTLRYGAAPSQRIILLKPAAAAPLPVVAWIHGGGWMAGDPTLRADAPQRMLLQHGMAVASIGYRLSDQAHFPAQLLDVRAAVRHLAADAERLGLDGACIGAWGASAGGHLAALLGTAAHVQFDDAALRPPEPALRCVVDWFGPTDLLAMDAQTAAAGCPPFRGSGHDAPSSPESRLFGFPIQQQPHRVRLADPAEHVTADVPPFLVMHGDRDCTVPLAQSEHLVRQLRMHRPDTQLVVLPGAGHGGAAFRSPETLQHVVAFLRQHLL